MGAIIISKKGREQPVYGFDKETHAFEVSDLIDTIIKNLGLDKVRIYVLSGIEGDVNGNLVGEKIFFMEDRSKELLFVTAVNVNENTPSNIWQRYFDQTKAIIILAWCYSSKWNGLVSYNN